MFCVFFVFDWPCGWAAKKGETCGSYLFPSQQPLLHASPFTLFLPCLSLLLDLGSTQHPLFSSLVSISLLLFSNRVCMIGGGKVGSCCPCACLCVRRGEKHTHTHTTIRDTVTDTHTLPLPVPLPLLLPPPPPSLTSFHLLLPSLLKQEPCLPQQGPCTRQRRFERPCSGKTNTQQNTKKC